MKHTRVAATSFAPKLSPLKVLTPLAGFAACLAGALPARGVEVPFTEQVISTAANGVVSVFATDMDGDGNTDVLSALHFDDKIAWYQSDCGKLTAYNIERRQCPSGPWTDVGMAIESEITLIGQSARQGMGISHHHRQQSRSGHAG